MWWAADISRQLKNSSVINLLIVVADYLEAWTYALKI